MQNRVPVVQDDKDKVVLTRFTPVSRQKVRHDECTPERQRLPETPNLRQRSTNFLYFRAGSRVRNGDVLA